MLWKKVIVRNRERALLFRDKQFSRILMPGVHRILVSSDETLEAEKHCVDNVVFHSNWADYLLREEPELADRHFVCVETNETQIAMVYVNGQLFTVLVPAKRLLFWRDAAEVTAEVVDLAEEETKMAS